MKFYLNIQIIGGFILTIGVLSVLGYVSYVENQQYQHASRMVAHTNDVLYHSQQVLSIAIDIETGLRGFVITGDTSFLEPYNNGVSTIYSNINYLLKLTGDNPIQQRRLLAIQVLLNKRLQFDTEVIQSRVLNFEAARTVVATGRGKAKTDEIRAIISDFQKDEKLLLERRQKEQSLQLQSFNGSSLSLFVVMVLVLFIFFFLISWNLGTRAKSEIQVKKSLEQIQDLYNNAPCGYHSLNAAEIIVEINDTELKWLGYERGEVVNKLAFTDLLTETDSLLFTSKSPLFRTQRSINDLEFDLVRKDGSLLPVVMSTSATFDEKGQYLKSRSSVFDNTDRKYAQQMLEKSLKVVKDLYDNAPCGYYSMNKELVFTDINQTALAWLGYTHKEVVGKMNFFDVCSEESIQSFQPSFEEFMKRYYNDGSISSLPLVYKRKDGSCFPVMVNAIAEKDEQGEPIGSRVSLFDFTIQKEAADRIIELNKELEAFTYSVSHDLRAPLRSIDGYSKVLREDYAGILDEEGQKVLGIVSNNAKRMGELIDALLEFSRLGRKDLTRSNNSMDEFVKPLLEELVQRENGRKIKLDVRPLGQASFDVNMLRQVWVNLLSNALKYTSKMEETKIEVGSFHTEATERVFYVRDNGAGFDMNYAHKLFGVFQRLHKTREFEGTGVGLALTKRIIDKHGGRIWADAEVNMGATFYFTLPIN